MNFGILFAALFLILLIYIVIRVMIVPIQWIVKILVNSAIALVGLLILNLVGGFWGIHLPVNPVSVLLLAVLGVPGLILLIIMNFLMV